MEYVEVLILAVVQGVAEFLPISSSGHLVVLQTLFGELGFPLDTDTLTLNIALHVGTLGAIVVVYARRIVEILRHDRRMIPLVLVGTIPAAVIGIGLKKYAEQSLESAMVAGWMFLVTGALLFWTTRIGRGETTSQGQSFRSAVLIGLFQALAILPGVSRSGATIVAGLTVGLKRDDAATFSFMLAIPAIGGAGLLETIDVLREPSEQVSVAILLMGAAVSFVVGVAALLWLLRWLAAGRLHWFAWYLLVLGPTVIVWRLLA